MSAAAGSADGAAAASAAELCNLGAVEAVARMSQGALTAERYAHALLARCRTANALNAFITLEPDRVLEDARTRDRERLAGAKPGPLFGLPIPVKDSVNTRDYPTTGGTPALRHFRPKDDAPVVAALRGRRGLVRVAALRSYGDLPVGVVAEIEDEIAARWSVELEVVGDWGGEGLGVGDGSVVGVEVGV